jgi:hypothetical protein
MNKRIAQLAYEAKLFDGTKNSPVDAATKFAELIVRECCDMFVELRTRPADLAAKDVKQHFGIE